MDRLFVLQGADITQLLADESFELVRTYKGDIERTQTGVIKDFPNSFITVGINATFIGPREQVEMIQQILLSADVVEVKTNYTSIRTSTGTTIKGKFSCTTNKCTELRDKQEKHLQLEVALVSDGTDIGDNNGTPFNIRVDGNIVGTAYFAKVYKLSTACKKAVPGTAIYMNIPNNELLVIEPEYLVSQ